ncbi:MAG: PQQ-dependent sugar dehydrogenase [Planctomycetes bacterium]|nr:PQQ-dependent sugar dehydrogenase [Planctomycetota bacterium]
MRTFVAKASLATAIVTAAIPCRGQAAQSQPLDDGPAIAFAEAFPAQEPFERPLFVAFDGSDPGMAYVVTQPGRVLRVPRHRAAAERSVFLDLSEVVYMGHNEEGLLGFAFDPHHAENGYVYAYWSERIEAREGAMAGGRTRSSDRQSVISRFTVVRRDEVPTVDPATELRVLEVFQPFGNHNGGTIVFGPDAMLYVALGDGGAANDPYGNAESLEMLLGKVLRIDVGGAAAGRPYAVPADNPFVGREGARGEIWCYGLRNPWRIAFDRETGDLWCGDVGQNRIEEVDRLVKGGFYGWNSWEAGERFAQRRSKEPTPADPIAPIAEYGHLEGLSITGGHVYRGDQLPGLRGFFVYGDFMTKRMWACREDREAGQHTVVRLEPAPLQPSSFAEEPEGELLVTCFQGKEGKVLRLVPAVAPAGK